MHTAVLVPAVDREHVSKPTKTQINEQISKRKKRPVGNNMYHGIPYGIRRIQLSVMPQ